MHAFRLFDPDPSTNEAYYKIEKQKKDYLKYNFKIDNIMTYQNFQ